MNLPEEEKKNIQELDEIIKQLGPKERAMASGYVSALRDMDMLEEKQAAV